MQKIAQIYGYGPVGLTAAWAALSVGWRVRIIAERGLVKPDTRSAGVFYLHSSIGLPLRHVQVLTQGFGGDEADYQQKVYGRFRSNFNTSFPNSPARTTAWDMGQAIDLMHDIVITSRPGVEMRQIRRGSLAYWALEEEFNHPADAYISTLPLSLFLGDDCASRPAWVETGDAPADEAYVLYSANPAHQWYRCSAVFGRFTMEFATDQLGGSQKVQKVETLKGKIPVLSPAWLLTGRGARWDKKLLVHNTYDEVRDFLNGR